MSRRPRPSPHVALLAVLTAALTMAVLTAPAPPAPAVEPATGQLAVQLTGLTPIAPRPGDTLVVTGRLQNTTAEDLRTVSVRLRLSPTPVVSRKEVARIADGRTVRLGNTLWNTQQALAPLLPAGQSVEFTISVPVDDLGLSATAPSVQVLGVEGLGDRVVGDGLGAEPLGLTTTFVPWFPDPTAVVPTNLVWLWPLSAPPSLDPGGAVLAPGPGPSVTPGGRLRTLLDLAERSPAPLSYLLDPALLQTVSAIAAPHRVVAADGTTTGTPANPGAADWLTDLRGLLTRPGASATALPYAVPDAVALHRAGMDLDLTRSVTDAADRAQRVLQQPVASTMAAPAGGVTDAGTLDVLRASGAQTVLLQSDSLPPEQGAGQGLDGVAPLTDDGRVTAVLADSGLAAVLAQPTVEPGSPLLVRQQLLAEVAQATVQAPRRGRTVVAAPPMDWDPEPATVTTWLAALTDTPWMRGVPLASLLALPAAAAPAPPRDLAAYRRQDRRLELSQRYLRHVAAQQAELRSFRALTADPSDTATAGFEDALAGTESAQWRTDRAGGRRLLGATAGALSSLTARVRIVSRGSTTFPGESGVVPIVVANDLDQPVRVGVLLSGTPAVRFEADPYPPFTVAPGTKRSVEVPARILGSGDVDVQVQLTT
ncbi:MAG TPA: DUF6049 family protein, partial [Candidatus Nanopelagicales bacterium]|nr:DUF6049 family protein [Candidatus Nanopelagicales bacterium]